MKQIKPNVYYVGAIDWDRQMSEARGNLDWEAMLKLAIDPEKATAYRASSLPNNKEVCTMCGDLCAVKRSREVLEDRRKRADARDQRSEVSPDADRRRE